MNAAALTGPLPWAASLLRAAVVRMPPAQKPMTLTSVAAGRLADPLDGDEDPMSVGVHVPQRLLGGDCAS